MSLESSTRLSWISWFLLSSNEATVGILKSDPEGLWKAFDKGPKDGSGGIKLMSDAFKEVVETTIVNSNSNLISGNCFINFL